MERRRPADFGKRLNTVYRIGAAHALFRETGDWYMELERFPGVLFDSSGFVLFNTKSDFDAVIQSGHIRMGSPVAKDQKRRMDVPNGISSIPGYTFFSDYLVRQSYGLTPDYIEIVVLLLRKGFPRHRIAALFDVDQKIINEIASERAT